MSLSRILAYLDSHIWNENNIIVAILHYRVIVRSKPQCFRIWPHCKYSMIIIFIVFLLRPVPVTLNYCSRQSLLLFFFLIISKIGHAYTLIFLFELNFNSSESEKNKYKNMIEIALERDIYIRDRGLTSYKMESYLQTI